MVLGFLAAIHTIIGVSWNICDSQIYQSTNAFEQLS